jgi:hypothetical protein
VDRVLRCHCGFEARAEGDDELIADVQRHAREAHEMVLTRDEALVLVFRAELDDEAPSAIPHRAGRTDEEEER